LKNSGLIEVEHRFDEKHHGQKTSKYHFAGLIEEATKFARLALEEKAENKSRKAARLNRKNPQSKTDIRVATGTMPTN
jgi:hypothetical protein